MWTATVLRLVESGQLSVPDTLAEVARMRGVSERTVQRQWEKARLLMHRALS